MGCTGDQLAKLRRGMHIPKVNWSAPSGVPDWHDIYYMQYATLSQALRVEKVGDGFGVQIELTHACNGNISNFCNLDIWTCHKLTPQETILVEWSRLN